MSTKIFNGFKFKNPDILIIREQLLEFQKEVDALTSEAIHTEIAGTVCGLHSGKFAIHKDETLLRKATTILENVMREADDKKERTGYDHKFEIVVIPLRKDMTLGMFYGEQRSHEKALKRQPWFEDYAYWDNTDWPDGMTKSEWNNRQRDWEDAVGDDAPSNRGFTMSLHRPYWYSLMFRVDPEIVLQEVERHWLKCTMKDLLGKNWKKILENYKKMLKTA